MGQTSRQIASIQMLRALAALMVVLGHVQSEAKVAALRQGFQFEMFALLPWGAGVDLFFVISGFIMVVASEQLFAAPGGSTRFVLRRLKRIVPLYWLFTALYVLVRAAIHKPVGSGDFIASLLFWPRDVYGDGVLRPIYSLGWTLNYEMFFYALFATALVLPRRAAVAAVAASLMLGVAAGQVFHLSGPLQFWTQPIVLEFALGMGLGLAWREGVRLGTLPRLALAAAGLAVLVYDPMGSSHQSADWITPNDLARLASWGLPAAALAAAAALGTARRDLPPVCAGGVAIGDASYALYLVHPFLIGALLRAWTRNGLMLSLGPWSFVACAVVLSIAAALAIHRWFELPLSRALALPRLDGKPVTASAS